MHPQIRLAKPGKCPICAMDLIPAGAPETDREADGERRLVTTEAAKRLMDIRTSPVERKFVTAEVRMVGKVEYDETKLAYLTAWVPGRLDRLYVDYTGVEVKKGDHMVYLYSPELFAAQEELLQAINAANTLDESGLDIIRETTLATVEAARERLRRWGLKPEQIAEIEKRGTATDHVTIHAPMSGIVIHRSGQQGMYVDTGTRIYTIADLSTVWVKLDAYESDLVWLRYGQDVTLSAEAYPAELFSGKIAFIAPVLNEKTRTVKVRVNVPNPDGKLKPNMFVRAIVRPSVAAAGRVMEPHLAGKWICPMHPEIVKDEAGACDICGMDLVTAESLGYVAVRETEAIKPLVVPASAPLVTGKRAIVYVEEPDAERPTYAGKEVVLGPRAGDYYIVREGLKEGERVVTNGNFKIDSALQIHAKPSMMQPEGGVRGGMAHRHHGTQAPSATPPESGPKLPQPRRPETKAPALFQEQLAKVYRSYLSVHAALAADDVDGALDATSGVTKSLEGVNMTLLGGEAHVIWMNQLTRLRNADDEMRDSKEIDALRAAFGRFSRVLAEAITAFGIGAAGPVYRIHCPMAFDDKGAEWLQDNQEIRNPFYGPAMLKCGEVIEAISEEAAKPGGHVHE